MNKAIVLMLDNVLITTRSGKPFPLHSEDWKFKIGWDKMLSHCIKEGYKIVITDNQFGVGKNGYMSDILFNKKIENICKIIEKDLHLPNNTIITNFCFDETDTFRIIPKPALLYEVGLDYEIVLADSLLVGINDEHLEFARMAGIGTYYELSDIEEIYK